MTHMPLGAAFVAAALLVASAASGQERPVLSLTPVESAQWDIAAHVGWLASSKSDIGADWDDWYNAIAGGASIGRYLTPHVKTEIHAAMSGEGRMYGQDPVPLTAAFPVFLAREHHFRTATVGAGLSYQFFENQWFHPFVGGGIEVLRERHRVRVPQQFVPTVPTRAPFPIAPEPFLIVPAVSLAPEVSYAARPFVTAGFKWYVAERTFFRTTIQSSFSNRGTTHVVWAAGIGADL